MGNILTQWKCDTEGIETRLQDSALGQLETNSPRRAVELQQILAQLGPSFVKIGQALSSRPDLLPQVYLEVCLQKSPLHAHIILAHACSILPGMQ